MMNAMVDSREPFQEIDNPAEWELLNVIRRYDYEGLLIECNPAKNRFIVDRKPMRETKRMHNRYQVLGENQNLIGLFRTLQDARNCMNKGK